MRRRGGGADDAEARRWKGARRMRGCEEQLNGPKYVWRWSRGCSGKADARPRGVGRANARESGKKVDQVFVSTSFFLGVEKI
jgi:hypothetical protein